MLLRLIQVLCDLVICMWGCTFRNLSPSCSYTVKNNTALYSCSLCEVQLCPLRDFPWLARRQLLSQEAWTTLIRSHKGAETAPYGHINRAIRVILFCRKQSAQPPGHFPHLLPSCFSLTPSLWLRHLPITNY